MTHNHVYDIFVKMFPLYLSENLVYFPNGKNSIRLRGLKNFPGMRTRQDVIFSCNHDCSEWKLETMDSYLRSLKGLINNA